MTMKEGGGEGRRGGNGKKHVMYRIFVLLFQSRHPRRSYAAQRSRRAKPTKSGRGKKGGGGAAGRGTGRGKWGEEETAD